jgi:hypothetical protein
LRSVCRTTSPDFVTWSGPVPLRPNFPGEHLYTTLTHPYLTINCSTSAGGGLRVELQDADGKPLSGFRLAECRTLVGDAIKRTVSWTKGGEVSSLAGRVVRIRFVLQEADLFAIRFMA